MALELAEGLEDGEDRNGVVAWYRRAFKPNPELERIGG